MRGGACAGMGWRRLAGANGGACVAHGELEGSQGALWFVGCSRVWRWLGCADLRSEKGFNAWPEDSASMETLLGWENTHYDACGSGNS